MKKSCTLFLLALLVSFASFAVGPITGTTTTCVGTTTILADTSVGGAWSSSSTGIATVGITSGVVTGISTGTAVISYLKGTSLATIIVTITSGPVISGPSAVCAGFAITLSDITPGGTWSAGSSAIATVSAGGIVTGASAGVTNISYSAGGCSAFHTVTVSGGASISGPAAVCVGATITLSDVIPGGSWSSSNIAIATVDTASGVVTGIASGTAVISYLAGGCYSFYTVTVNGGSPVTGPSVVCAGSAITLSDSVTGGAYFSGNTAVATVDISSGMVTGTSAGTDTISYILGGCSALYTVTVTGGSSVTGPSTVCAASAITLTDTTSGGAWSSSDTSIASVGITSGSVTGVSSGVTTIYYTVSGCAAYHTVTVTGGYSAISGASAVCVGSTITLIDPTPGGLWSSSNTSVANAGITSGIVTGISAGIATISYVAGGCNAYHTVTVSGGASIAGPSVVCLASSITLSDATPGGTWASGNSAIATVSAGLVNGISNGVTDIYYSVGGCFAFHTVTVTGGTPISGPSSVCAGATITLSDAISGGVWTTGATTVATAGFSSGVVTGVAAGAANISYSMGGCSVLYAITVIPGAGTISGPAIACTGSAITLIDTVPGGTWSTSGTTIAAVGSGSGVVTALTTGVANIYYTIGSCYAFQTVTVAPNAGTISGPAIVCTGSAITLHDGVSGGSWSTSNSAIATVGLTSGIVNGLSTGVVTIYYTLGSCSAAYTITVGFAGTVSGPSGICAGAVATLSDAVTGGTWSTVNTTIATVDTVTGVVTGIGAGIANIYYSEGGCYAYHSVSVTGSTTISGPATVCTGAAISLSDVTSGGTWTTSGTGIASVSFTSGMVTGLSAGTENIIYTIGSCSSIYTVTVTAGPGPVSGLSTVCAGSVITLSDASAGGAWISSASSVATVDSTSGVVSGVSSGVVNIYYSSGGCYAYQTVTVVGAPISGPDNVCAGSAITLSDIATGGTWSTSNSAVATITSGVVTGVAAGTTSIVYSVGGCSSSYTVTVNPGAGAISGATSVCAGLSVLLTDAAPGGTWSTSGTVIATIDSASGVVSTLSAGSVNITYSVGTCTAGYTVTVNAGAGIITGASAICAGSPVTLSDTATFGSWTSASTTIATVGITSGVVSGVSSGTTAIFYTVGTCSTLYIIAVTDATIAGPSAVCAGAAISLSDITSGGTWTSATSVVATVDSVSGMVTGLSSGVADISYSISGCTALYSVTVTSVAISGLSVICTGSAVTLSDATPGGTWTSTSTSIATVDSASGLVTGLSAGIAAINYTANGCSAALVLTVNATPDAITGATVVPVGDTITLSDSTAGGTWSTTTTVTASVDSVGDVTGLSVGAVSISYTVGGCAASVIVTVTGPGSISGTVVTGAGKGTADGVPVVGLLVNLKDTANNIIANTTTDTAGAYSFNGIANGAYVVDPVDTGFTTTVSTMILVDSATENITGVDFIKYLGSKIIVPVHTTGVKPVSAVNSIGVYPNPTSGELNIKWNNRETGNAEVVVTDVTGREVYKSVLNINTTSGQSQIGLSELKTGIYLLTIKSDNIYYTAKLMIQK